MTIDTRAREAAHRAHQEVAAIVVPDADAVVGRRRVRHHARLAMASAAAVVLIAVGSGVAVISSRDTGRRPVAVNPSTPTTAPTQPGLSFQSFHTSSCPFQGIDGCGLVPDSGTSSDIASVSVQHDGASRWVIDLTLTPAAAKRFAKDAMYNAYIDGVQVSATPGERGTLVLAGSASGPWDVDTANVLAARILATR
jgi:hypothetical protein